MTLAMWDSVAWQDLLVVAGIIGLMDLVFRQAVELIIQVLGG